MIKLIAFDLDDTLYDESTFVIGGFKAVSKYIAAKYHLNEEQLLDSCMEVLNTKGRGKIFDELCKKYNLQEDIAYLIKVYRNNEEPLKLFSDAEEVLESLKKSNYKTAIVTDGMAFVQRNKIKALKLEQLVDYIVVTDEHGAENWKPSSYAFKLLLSKFDLMGSEAVYVGDNPKKDFIGARAAGFKTIRIIREIGVHRNLFLDREHEADINMKNLTEIEHYLKGESL
ncbi:HAD family hydrolase [Clostridium oryzae]|uniref:(S)-2-haloacid dehalogenase 4A n=1 Tax=Clostridium oryzae TaxID=1450648 RepID=A0A1V4ILH9_9CLOT|nr:HAD-IA family hydrolase [Clostridium oryzae]OPJ60888.1 (S)-2-haloacid dehalogenase 4A [Clostridium oryzae]